MAYLSYPYSDNPEKRTKEVIQLARKIVKVKPKIALIIPHLNYDIFMHTPDGIEKLGIRPETFLAWELEVISRCDFLINGYGEDLSYEISPGACWEIAFCKKLGISVKTLRDLGVK